MRRRPIYFTFCRASFLYEASSINCNNTLVNFSCYVTFNFIHTFTKCCFLFATSFLTTRRFALSFLSFFFFFFNACIVDVQRKSAATKQILLPRWFILKRKKKEKKWMETMIEEIVVWVVCCKREPIMN